MRQRVDLSVFATVTVDSAETGEGVLAINVHSARAADALTARPTKGKSGVNFVLDFDESIQNLGIY